MWCWWLDCTCLGKAMPCHGSVGWSPISSASALCMHGTNRNPNAALPTQPEPTRYITISPYICKWKLCSDASYCAQSFLIARFSHPLSLSVLLVTLSVLKLLVVWIARTISVWWWYFYFLPIHLYDTFGARPQHLEVVVVVLPYLSVCLRVWCKMLSSSHARRPLRGSASSTVVRLCKPPCASCAWCRVLLCAVCGRGQVLVSLTHRSLRPRVILSAVFCCTLKLDCVCRRSPKTGISLLHFSVFHSSFPVWLVGVWTLTLSTRFASLKTDFIFVFFWTIHGSTTHTHATLHTLCTFFARRVRYSMQMPHQWD